jgi:hypothetical protein
MECAANACVQHHMLKCKCTAHAEYCRTQLTLRYSCLSTPGSSPLLCCLHQKHASTKRFIVLFATASTTTSTRTLTPPCSSCPALLYLLPHRSITVMPHHCAVPRALQDRLWAGGVPGWQLQRSGQLGRAAGGAAGVEPWAHLGGKR